MRGGIKTKEEFTNKKIRVVRDHDLTMESTKTTKLLKIKKTQKESSESDSKPNKRN